MFSGAILILAPDLFGVWGLGIKDQRVKRLTFQVFSGLDVVGNPSTSNIPKLASFR